jgi:hypothetical protein
MSSAFSVFVLVLQLNNIVDIIILKIIFFIVIVEF